jgi:polyisoprenoid-binding protein YceI
MRSHVLAGAAVALVANFLPIAADAADYDIDVTHSQISFKVRHLGISNVTGTFDDFNGWFSFDPENMEAGAAEVNITASSVNTRNADRDEHLRAPDFLSIEEFPMITFKSTGISDVDGSEMKIHGDLTLHGVTKAVVFDAEMTGMASDPWGNDRVAFEADTKIDRREFGLTWSKAMETGGLLVGNDVRISIEVEGVQRKAEQTAEK